MLRQSPTNFSQDSMAADVSGRDDDGGTERSTEIAPPGALPDRGPSGEVTDRQVCNGERGLTRKPENEQARRRTTASTW